MRATSTADDENSENDDDDDDDEYEDWKLRMVPQSNRTRPSAYQSKLPVKTPSQISRWINRAYKRFSSYIGLVTHRIWNYKSNNQQQQDNTK